MFETNFIKLFHLVTFYLVKNALRDISRSNRETTVVTKRYGKLFCEGQSEMIKGTVPSKRNVIIKQRCLIMRHMWTNTELIDHHLGGDKSLTNGDRSLGGDGRSCYNMADNYHDYMEVVTTISELMIPSLMIT